MNTRTHTSFENIPIAGSCLILDCLYTLIRPEHDLQLHRVQTWQDYLLQLKNPCHLYHEPLAYPLLEERGTQGAAKTAKERAIMA